LITGWTEEDIRAFEPQLLDPEVGFDVDDYVAYARVRSAEVSSLARSRVVAQRREVMTDGVPVEHYRRLSIRDALAMLLPSG
jgi:hypothetical protein